jgi:peptide/nickel transport system ATP-binding protein
MYLGRIVETGPVETILRSPKHPYTQALLSVASAGAGSAAVILGGEPPDPARIPAGCRFHPRCPALGSGVAAAAGVEAACRAVDPRALPGGRQAAVACHLFPRSP